MGHYDFELDLYTDNANADIIQRIKRGGEILEFGPAFGRMTQYLHEEMNCIVDIVEMNPEAGAAAARFARQSCLGPEEGDIESGAWERAFSTRRYDAIVFTDVLEHLHDPRQVLNRCRSFLKQDGIILCSIPNIAHSSVILGLLGGKFQYTDTGLLDRTHIHFFTEESFCNMIAECDYYVTYEHAIVMPVGTIEIPFTYENVCRDVENALRQRPNNEAYQFIFELKKKVPGRLEESVIVTEPSQARRCVCYVKEGTEASFSEQKKMCQAVVPGINDTSFSLRSFPDARAVRIMLLDSNSILRLKKITAVAKMVEEELTQFDTSGFLAANHLLCFFNSNADIYIWLPEGKQYDAIRIQYDILVYNSDVLSVVGNELCTGLIEEKEQLSSKVNELVHENNELNSNIQSLLAKDREREESHAELLSVQDKLQKQLLAMEEEIDISSEKVRIFSEENASVRKELLNTRKEIETEFENSNKLSQLLKDTELKIVNMNFLNENLVQQNNSLSKQNEQQALQLDDILLEKQMLFKQVAALNIQLSELSIEFEKMKNSLSWKITVPARFVRSNLEQCQKAGSAISKLWNNTIFYYKHYGLKASLYRAAHYRKIKDQELQHLIEIKQETQQVDLWEQLNDWIDTTSHKFIDIFPVPMGWNTPLFQRFQHLSLQAGNAGGISFYGAHPSVDKDVTVYKFITPALCIVNLDNPDVTEKFWQVLDQKAGLKFLRIQSIDLATDITKIESFIKRGYQIVYEYIDELTSQITGTIPEFVYKRHEYLLRNEDVTVIATSDKLFDQVKPYREHNMLMLNNGVSYEHWHLDPEKTKCPEELKPIVSQGKIIIGYHGALAQWIDYDLLNRIAGDKRFILLLIGYEHDGNLKKSQVLDNENVYYLGSRNYQELNRYAAFYDIAILPFKKNNITLSVSPVKIFEYMAAGKPVVSYALPECKKYQSCLCADTQTDFIMQIEKAIQLRNDPAYLEQLQKDALDNTWLSITLKMVEHVKCGYNKALNRRNDLKLLNPALDSSSKDRYMEEILRFPKYYDIDDYRQITDAPYRQQDGDCKIIAYYLTQYHPDPHNEEWWGKGVTEWNNVCRAIPQYPGHYQPRLPGELGFYDLRILENMKRQIELAQMYGIFGFSFYYYWFNGDRLLEQPLEMFLSNKELNFPFSLCWANENWTKRFDGTNEDILMEQPGSVESYKNVIHDMARFLSDYRYIEINGKKMITVYRPSLMPQVRLVLNYWRDFCRIQGIGELHLIAVKENMIDIDWLKEGYDAVSEFHPGTLYTNCLKINSELKFLRKDFNGEVFSYSDIVHKQKYFRYDLPKLYRAVMPMWDNTARRDNKGMIFQGSTPALYKRWLKDVIAAGKDRDDIEENVIFINAWNEWGEGAYLEPDKRYGYAYLEATKEAVEESRI